MSRFTSTGQPDPTFGANGTALISDPDATYNSILAGAAAVTADGRVVVAGQAYTGTGLGSVVTAAFYELTADGHLNPAFGTGGVVHVPAADRQLNPASAMSVLADGRILAAGYITGAGGGAVRLTPTGQADPTYGSGGVSPPGVIPATSGPASRNAIDTAGRVLFSSSISGSQGTTSTRLYRLTPAGTLDTGLGTNGRVALNSLPGLSTIAPADLVLGATAILPDGDIVLSGTDRYTQSSQSPTTGGLVVRLIGTNPPAGFVAAGRGTLAAGGPADGTATTLRAAADGTYSAAGTTAVYPGFAGETRAATADVTGDGTPDYVYAAGPGGAPEVTVIDGATGRLVADFPAFEGSFAGGVFVAAADLDGDGRAEVVATPDQGGGGRVVVFSVYPGGAAAQRASFLGIDDPAFRGGARVALGDVDGDGTPDVVVAAGFGGGPRTAIFTGRGVLTGTPARLVGDFYAFPGADAATLRNGAYVAAGDVTGDGKADLVFGGGPGGGPRVFILSGALVAAGNLDGAYAAPVANFFVNGNATARGGVRVAVTDFDGDGRADVAAGSGAGEVARVRVYRGGAITGGGEPISYGDLGVFGAAVLADGVYVG